MSIESSSDDGADIFWPGYVDAVTNLVLNLLFMLTIMIVAVFMFALELSRHKDNAAATATAPTETVPTPAPQTPQEQVVALQKEVDALRKQVLQKNDIPKDQKVVNAKTPLPKPDKELREITPLGGGVVVNFAKDAVALSGSEAETLNAALGPMVAAGRARVEVLVPTGFSEARRIGFYRVMAVRNQLIAAGLKADAIEVLIRDGSVGAENSRVVVSPLARK